MIAMITLLFDFHNKEEDMVKGGYRKGAGRPAGTGKYKEQTKPVRVPISMISEVQTFLTESKSYELPLYACRVSAGFPSPADDYLEGSLDLNQYLVPHPEATFFVRVTGDSMINAGIFPNDILIVDRSVTPKHGKVIIAVLDGELTVKRLYQKEGKTMLLPENKQYKPIPVREESDFMIWGVVSNVIHAL